MEHCTKFCQANLDCCSKPSWSWTDHIPCNVPIRPIIEVLTLKVCFRVCRPHSSCVPQPATKYTCEVKQREGLSVFDDGKISLMIDKA